MIALLLSSLLASTGPASPTEGCPAETATARRIANRFMTSDTYVEERQALGIGDLTQADVLLLTDTADAVTCRALNEAITLQARPFPRVATYFRVGTRLMVITTTQVPPDRLFLGWEHLLVLDTGLRPLDGFAM